MSAYPQQVQPNGWQIFGQALNQGAEVLQDEQDRSQRLRMLMQEMALKRSAATIAKIKADRETQMATEKDAREKAERERSQSVRTQLASGKTVPGKAVNGVIAPDETMPYSPEEANRMLLSSGDLSGKEFADSVNPAKSIEGQKEIFGFKDAAASSREEKKQSFQAAQEAFRQGKMDARSFAAIKAGFDKSQTAQAGKQFNQEQKLQEKFLTQTKDYRDIRDAFGRIQVSAKDPSPAGDLGLIFNYMKMLDPGSTVREGEFATAAASGSYGDRIQAAASKLVNGERLSPDQRKDFLDRAKSLYVQQAKQAKKTEGQTRKQAKAYGLDENRAVTDIGIADDSNSDPLGLGF